MNHARPSDLVRHTFVVIVWFAAVRLVADYGVRLLPLSLARQLTLQSYLTGVALVTAALGLVLTFLLVPDPLRVLGLTRPSSGRLAALIVLSPAIYVVSSYIAIAIALPTLLAELAAGGRQAAQQSTGEFGRELVQTGALSALIWGVVVSPLSEELLFRGALWSLVQRALEFLRARIAKPPPASPDAELPEGVLSESLGFRAARALGRFFVTGGLATLVAALVFTLMHADMPGGLGIVRWASAAGLGIAAGIGRQLTSSLAGAIAVHVTYNALSLATARRWVVSESFPIKLGVPTLLSLFAIIAVIAVAIGAVISKRAAKRRAPIA